MKIKSVLYKDPLSTAQ